MNDALPHPRGLTLSCREFIVHVHIATRKKILFEMCGWGPFEAGFASVFVLNFVWKWVRKAEVLSEPQEILGSINATSLAQHGPQTHGELWLSFCAIGQKKNFLLHQIVFFLLLFFSRTSPLAVEFPVAVLSLLLYCLKYRWYLLGRLGVRTADEGSYPPYTRVTLEGCQCVSLSLILCFYVIMVHPNVALMITSQCVLEGFCVQSHVYLKLSAWNWITRTAC